MLSEACTQQGPFAPQALPRFVATTDPSATLSSSANFPGPPVIRPTLAPLISQRDEEGFSSCSMRLCHRAVAPSPAGASHRVSQTASARVAFAE
jgi:hypothetical protein